MKPLTKRRKRDLEKSGRGTLVWGMNVLRADGLTRLLDDLVELEAGGLESHQCRQVKVALQKITSRAAAIPDGSFWRRAIYQEFEAFTNVYETWNAREGIDHEAIANRRDALRKLRAIRHAIAKRVRVNQHVLQNELDLMLIDGMYGALKDLTLALPTIFTNLSLAVVRYESRKL